jgi:hypothetical protein
MSDEISPASEAARLRPDDDAPRKEKHDFLAALLRDSRSSLIDFGFKQAAVLTLLLGWFLSSKETHDFIKANQNLRYVIVPGISLYFAFLAFWIWSFRQRSNSAYQHLLNLRYMPKEFYSTLRITDGTAVTYTSAFLALCVVLVMALLQIK